MGTLSIGKAWEEALAFVKRESALLIPVALLFLAVPGLIVQEAMPTELSTWLASAQPRGDFPDIPVSFAIIAFLGAAAVWFGSLTIFALTLRPGISVGEALRLGGARLPVLIGSGILAGALFAIGIFLVILIGSIVAALSGGSAMALASVISLLAGGAMIYAAIRLALLNAVVIDGSEGVVASLRRSWAITRGQFWRLLSFLAIFTLLSMVVAVASQGVFGSIAGLIGGPSAAQFVGGMVSAAFSTIVQLYMLVMLARVYRQLVDD